MVDRSKIAPGDKVTVEMVVMSVREDALRLSLNGTDNCAWAWWDEWNIVSHTPAPPKPLQVGDKVKHKRSGHQYVVVAPPRKTSDCGEQVALWDDSIGYGAEYVRQLERVEP